MTTIEELHFRFDKHRQSEHLYQQKKYLYAHSYLNGEFSTAIDFSLADLYINGNIDDSLKHDAVDRIVDHFINDITLYDSRIKDMTRIPTILNSLPLYCDLSNGDTRVQFRTVNDLSMVIDNANQFGDGTLYFSFKIDPLHFKNTEDYNSFDDISFASFTKPNAIDCAKADAQRHADSFQAAVAAISLRKTEAATLYLAEAAKIRSEDASRATLVKSSILVFQRAADAARIRFVEALRQSSKAIFCQPEYDTRIGPTQATQAWSQSLVDRYYRMDVLDNQDIQYLLKRRLLFSFSRKLAIYVLAYHSIGVQATVDSCHQHWYRPRLRLP